MNAPRSIANMPEVRANVELERSLLIDQPAGIAHHMGGTGRVRSQICQTCGGSGLDLSGGMEDSLDAYPCGACRGKGVR